MNHIHTPRRGFTLIEKVIVMGMLSVISLFCGGMLFNVMRLDQSSADSLQDQQRWLAMSQAFLTDVRTARDVTWEPATQSLLIQSSRQQTITYRLDREVVQRVVTLPDGTSAHRERFPFLGSRVAIVSPAESGRAVWILEVARPTSTLNASRSPHPPRDVFRMEASQALGRVTEARP
jgi:prepilin-type N-terminal cleavage/methylation domain-containing protein